MKRIVWDKLKHINILLKKYEDFTNKNFFTRIKFYTSILYNYRPQPNVYLSPEKDDSFICEILEHGVPPNFLIKLPSGGNSNLFIKQG
jgi:hypothetical protein